MDKLFNAHQYTSDDLLKFYDIKNNTNFSNNIDDFLDKINNDILIPFFITKLSFSTDYNNNEFKMKFINFIKNLYDEKICEKYFNYTYNLSSIIFLLYDLLIKSYINYNYNINVNNCINSNYYVTHTDKCMRLLDLKTYFNLNITQNFKLLCTNILFCKIELDDDNILILRNMSNLLNKDFNDEYCTNYDNYLVELQYYDSFLIKNNYINLINMNDDTINLILLQK